MLAWMIAGHTSRDTRKTFQRFADRDDFDFAPQLMSEVVVDFCFMKCKH